MGGPEADTTPHTTPSSGEVCGRGHRKTEKGFLVIFQYRDPFVNPLVKAEKNRPQNMDSEANWQGIPGTSPGSQRSAEGTKRSFVDDVFSLVCVCVCVCVCVPRLSHISDPGSWDGRPKATQAILARCIQVPGGRTAAGE